MNGKLMRIPGESGERPTYFYLYELIGVVSWGYPNCTKSDEPGVYGRVPSVLSWIEDNVNADGSISCPRI